MSAIVYTAYILLSYVVLSVSIAFAVVLPLRLSMWVVVRRALCHISHRLSLHCRFAPTPTELTSPTVVIGLCANVVLRLAPTPNRCFPSGLFPSFALTSQTHFSKEPFRSCAFYS